MVGLEGIRAQRRREFRQSLVSSAAALAVSILALVWFFGSGSLQRNLHHPPQQIADRMPAAQK